MIEPVELYNYAIEYRDRVGNFPRILSAANHFKVGLYEIEAAVEDYTGAGYMGIGVPIEKRDRVGLGTEELLVEVYKE